MPRKVKLFAAVFSLSFLFSAPAALASFPDVFQANPFAAAVDYVQLKGIVSGYPNGLYEPDREINRAEFTKILIKTKYNEMEISGCKGGDFPDVEAAAWYAPYVCKAREAGVIGGYPDGTFRPENQINFAEAAKIIVKTLKAGELEGKDYGESVWYEPYVRFMAEYGALPLQVPGPEKYVSRGLMAELIYRLNENVTNKESFSYEEFGDLALIQSYYEYIGWDLDKAYSMKVDPGMSLAAFKEMYEQDHAYYVILKLKKVAAHTYDFYVRTSFDPSSSVSSALYHVKMEVVDGRLKTHFAEPADNLTVEEIKFSDSLIAKIVWSGGMFKVYSVKDGTEKLVNESSASQVWPRNLKFSASGNYLTYEVIAWEYGGVYLYDVLNGGLNEQPYDGLGIYGFAGDEKYFYFCSETGMSSGMAFVLDMPGYGMRSDLQDDASVASCEGFDAMNNRLFYKLMSAEGKSVSFVYDIVNDVVSSDI